MNSSFCSLNLKITINMQEIQTETQNELTLELKVTDLNTVKYLKSFEQSLSSEKALEALRIGVIAIQSASPTLDTKIVDEKFQVISSLIDEVFGERNGKLPKLFKDYFGNDESKLAQIFKDYLEQDKGKMPKIFQQYFGDDKNTNGKLSQIIQKQVGPESEFAKSIDPTNTNSIIYRFKNEVQENIKDLFVDLKEELGLQAGKEIGKKEEAEKGTEKGREFETVLYLRIAELGRQIGDLTESVGNTPGVVPRSKTGDYLITLGDTSAAPGTKIVIEAKSAKAYKLRDAIEELDEAKKNREAFAGIFEFSKGYEPPEVGDFHQVGNDFFITVDNEVLEDNQR